MASFVTRTMIGVGKAYSSAVPSTRVWSRVSRIVLRHSSPQIFGSPSQLPVPGEPGWNEFTENVKRYRNHPPLSPSQLQLGQDIFAMQQKMLKLEETVSKNS